MLHWGCDSASAKRHATTGGLATICSQQCGLLCCFRGAVVRTAEAAGSRLRTTSLRLQEETAWQAQGQRAAATRTCSRRRPGGRARSRWRKSARAAAAPPGPPAARPPTAGCRAAPPPRPPPASAARLRGRQHSPGWVVELWAEVSQGVSGRLRLCVPTPCCCPRADLGGRRQVTNGWLMVC